MKTPLLNILTNRLGILSGVEYIFCKHRKENKCLYFASWHSTAAKPDFIKVYVGPFTVFWHLYWRFLHFSERVQTLFLMISWHLSFSLYRLAYEYSHAMSLSVGRGQPIGVSQCLPWGMWRTSWRSGTMYEFSSPLFTPVDHTCWAYGNSSSLFLVLFSQGRCMDEHREPWNTQPGLFHQPKAARTATWSTSKHTKYIFTAKGFTESWPSETNIKKLNLILGTNESYFQ